MKYRIREKKNRKDGKPFLLLLTREEHEYLERVVRDRGGNMAQMVRGRTFVRGWRRELDDLRREQGALAEPAPIS